MSDPSTPHPALEAVRARIATAARESGRDAASVSLIAVSKTFEAPAIRPVLARAVYANRLAPK
jgi:hypothetical protein